MPAAARKKPGPTKTNFAPVTAEVMRIPLDFPQLRNWWIFFAGSVALLGLYVLSMVVLFWFGVGVWGVNIPGNWAMAIAMYIWWLGIGHA